MTPSTTENVGNNSQEYPEDRLVVAVRLRPHENEDLRRVVYSLDNKTVLVHEKYTKRQLESMQHARVSKTVVVHDKESARLDVLRQKRMAERQYEFDLVLGENATQEEVYEGTTRALVQRVVQGGNATVLAYGATGAGKTYTMVGTAQQPGVMVRALDDLFREATQTQETAVDSGAADSDSSGIQQPPPKTRQVAMSYLEVYNEKIRDLLSPNGATLELREDSQGGVRVAGLSEVFATSTEEVMRLLTRGNRARSVEPTAANKTSSRSHAMLQVSVVGRGQPEGRLLMVDLAGSERASNTKNRGKRLQEGAHINLSLLALGNCITALARGGDVRHINFRDSKLTRLLKGALTAGGGRRLSCVMIAHVAPGMLQREESRTTLLYAERAARISLAAAQNNRPAGFAAAQATLRAEKKRLRSEIERLRARLGDDEEDNNKVSVLEDKGIKITEEPVESQGELSDLKQQIVAAFRDQMRARRRLLEVDSQLLGLDMQSERHNLTLRRWEAKNGQLYRAARLSTTSYQSRGSRGRPWHTDPEDSDVSNSQLLEEEAQQSWRDLAKIGREQERLQAVRAAAQAELETSKTRALTLEQELSARVGSEWGEREVLALVCRVHELELERLEAHGAALAREHELRRRQSALRRHERQRQLCDQIITKQRQLIEEREVDLPEELEVLYTEYLRDVHASSFTAGEAQVAMENSERSDTGTSNEDATRNSADRINLPPLAITPTGFLTPTTPSAALFPQFSMRDASSPMRICDVTSPMRSREDSSPQRHEPEMMQIGTPNSSGDSGRESPLPPIQEISFSISQAMQLLGPPSTSGGDTSPILPPIRPQRVTARSPTINTSFGHPPAPRPPQSRLPRPLASRKSRNRGIRRVLSDEDMRE